MDRVVHLEKDWVSVVDAAYAPVRDDDEWVALVKSRTQDLFEHDIGSAVMVVEHAGDCATARTVAAAFPEGHRRIFEMADGGHSFIGQAGFRAMYYPPLPAITHTEMRTLLEPSARSSLVGFFENAPFTDAIGVLTHPVPGKVICLTAAFQRKVMLTHADRNALVRLGLHLSSAYRLRHRPESLVAVLDASGGVLERTRDAPAKAHLEAQGERLLSMQTRRTSDALELWPALLRGDLSIVGRGSGKTRRYLVLENPLASQPYRALSKEEVDVVGHACRGLSCKMIAFALGVSPSVVSDRLTQAATKLGASSRIELVRIAAMLTRDPRAGIPEANLTDAETDVLALLQEGLSNDEIARLRVRSIRTIANQVASLLRKTGTASRQALAARGARS